VQRYLSIDVLRGAAIILMVQVHFVDNLSSREPAFGWLYDASMLLGSFSAPVFTFLSGLSYFLWVRKQETQGQRNKAITRGTLRRGFFLFALGLVFNFCLWLPEETFNWDVLTLIGTAFLFLAFARKLPPAVLALMCVMALLISPLMRTVGDFGSYWEDGAYTYDFTFRDILFGFVANGYFPVFPWIIFPIMGYVCGDWMFRRKPEVTRWRACALGVGLLALSGACVAFGKHLPYALAHHYATGSTEFPASTEHVLGMLGFILVSLVLLHRWLDRPDNALRAGWFITVLTRFSYFSLTVYVLHHMVILWPLWLYGACTGHADSTVFWRHAMPTPVAFALAVIFLLACYVLLIRLDRKKKYSLESLMRRVCDGREPPKV
jgi:uncharacterized membrane protein